MRYLYFAALVLALLASCKSKPPATTSKPPAPKEAYTLSNLEADIVSEVNRYRKSKGLPALESSSVVATEAAVHSQRMASRQAPFGHDGFEERSARISKRLDGTRASAENVAVGKMSARNLVQSWLKSPAHKKNIEGRYTLTGVGISRDPTGTVYYTQIFVLK